MFSDCEAGGKIYQNGERLEDPESPCRVCYCQSGEIVCTVIKCYTRADCMPRYVTGKCCPKYDHCPPVGECQTKQTIVQSTLHCGLVCYVCFSLIHSLRFIISLTLHHKSRNIVNHFAYLCRPNANDVLYDTRNFV